MWLTRPRKKWPKPSSPASLVPTSPLHPKPLSNAEYIGLPKLSSACSLSFAVPSGVLLPSQCLTNSCLVFRSQLRPLVFLGFLRLTKTSLVALVFPQKLFTIGYWFFLQPYITCYTNTASSPCIPLLPDQIPRSHQMEPPLTHGIFYDPFHSTYYTFFVTICFHSPVNSDPHKGSLLYHLPLRSNWQIVISQQKFSGWMKTWGDYSSIILVMNFNYIFYIYLLIILLVFGCFSSWGYSLCLIQFLCSRKLSMPGTYHFQPTWLYRWP